jgi:hypothetical protein
MTDKNRYGHGLKRPKLEILSQRVSQTSIAFLIISLFFLGSLSAKADTNRVEGRKDSDDRKLV